MLASPDHLPAAVSRACIDQHAAPLLCRLLSEAAGGLGHEQLAQIERDLHGYPLRLLDITPGCDIASIMSQFGEFTPHRQVICCLAASL